MRFFIPKLPDNMAKKSIKDGIASGEFDNMINELEVQHDARFVTVVCGAGVVMERNNPNKEQVTLHPAHRLIKSGDWGGIITKRAEPILPNELLYDRKGQPVAIKTKGEILAILEGAE